MTISDATLQAYVDGELDASARAALEAAAATDPQCAQRLRQAQRLGELLRAAYDPVLTEPMPARLLASAHERASPVADLAAARARREAAAAAPRARFGGWQSWGALAASLLVGIVVGRSALTVPVDSDVVARAGHMVARGELARALSEQLASAQPADAPVHVGLSFASRSADYCRTFVLRAGGAAGLACRHHNDWQLHTRHGMRNAMLPVVTVVGLSIAGFLSGAILTETIFNLAGIGRTLFEAIQGRDYIVIQGVTLVVAIGYVMVNLVVDVSYAVLDPRIRLG